jgi:hypothetical protein
MELDRSMGVVEIADAVADVKVGESRNESG